jgi:hypothetical protein
MWRDKPELTREDLALSPRIVGLHGGSGCSDKIALTIKEFCNEKKNAKIDAFIHDPKTLQNLKFSRNDFGRGVASPTVFKADPRSPIEEMLLFLKNGQVWCQPFRGGDAVQVTSFAVDVNEFRLVEQPSLRCILVVSMSVYANKSPAETALSDIAGNQRGSAMIFDKLMVRHWDTWGSYQKRNHLFICSVDITPDSLLICNPTKAIDLMFGQETDCPTKPFGGIEDFSLSPDGRLLSFSARRVNSDGSQPYDMAWTTESNIHLVDITDCNPGAIKKISPDEVRGFCSRPTFSKCGTMISFLSMYSILYTLL